MSTLYKLISSYGLLAMFCLILLEYSCFPVSSEIILPLCGAVAIWQHIPFFLMLFLSVLAGLIGTSICFFIGRIGRNSLLSRLMKHFPKTKKPITASFQLFEKYGLWAVCFGRVIPICRTYIAFVAGASMQPYQTFFIASSCGILVWNTLLIGLGYYLKDQWQQISTFYSQYKHFILFGFGVAIFFYTWHAIKKSSISGN